MTSPDLYLSHAFDDVRLGAAIVDFLEEVIPAVDGHIACSAVPGYVASGSGARDNAMVIGLWSQAGRREVLADLLRAVECGRSALLLCEDPADIELPSSLSAVTVLVTDRSGLSALMEDVAYALGALPRVDQSCRDALSELVLAVHRERDMRRRGNETPLQVVMPMQPPAPQLHDPSDDHDVGSQPPDPHSAPVRVRAPATAASCAEVGSLLAECLFHDLPLAAEDVVPGGRVCGLYEALGGMPQPYPDRADVEGWQGLFDRVLEALPIERQLLASWFEAGFQLDLTCALAGGSDDGDDVAAITEARAGAWNEFSLSAGHLRLAPEFVHAVSGSISSLLATDDVLATEQGRVECLEYLCDAARMYDQQRAYARRERQALPA